MGMIAVTEVYLIWCRHACGYSKTIKYTMNISRLLLQWLYGQNVYTIYGKLLSLSFYGSLQLHSSYQCDNSRRVDTHLLCLVKCMINTLMTPAQA